MDGKSLDVRKEKLSRLKEILPEASTENKIDWEKLKAAYAFARDCEEHDDIEFYFKLPHWFKINTPIGSYNPDWALIKKNEKTIYFVAETKSTGQELRVTEKQKIKCGHAHFNEFEEVKFKQVANVSDLD